jgi:hypothetical protein
VSVPGTTGVTTTAGEAIALTTAGEDTLDVEAPATTDPDPDPDHAPVGTQAADHVPADIQEAAHAQADIRVAELVLVAEDVQAADIANSGQ